MGGFRYGCEKGCLLPLLKSMSSGSAAYSAAKFLGEAFFRIEAGR